MSENSVRFRPLLPTPGEETDADTLLDGMFASLSPGPEVPYTLANFVMSADGRAAAGGKSGDLGDAGDRAVFHGLRQRVDAVLAGTTTIRTENYGRILGKPERRRRRLEQGQSPEPLACMLTRSGNVPTGAPLFSEPEARVIVFGPEDLRTQLRACPAQVELVALDPDQLTWRTALARLRCDYGVGVLLCEGGPSVFGALLAAGLVDELFLTLAPRLLGGGDGPTISSGPELPALAPVKLRWLLEREHSLFARYAVG